MLKIPGKSFTGYFCSLGYKSRQKEEEKQGIDNNKKELNQ
jgi:hypothetical protein